ncbi:hypothetical protein [Kitasatospora camelliae]|uniref:SUKH-4 immunity protein of toxin-antitoxin system n=1 Tax=Kitasatospora camelliae TaxID=3156397 RepID=A0AAU8JW98_9ACTN
MSDAIRHSLRDFAETLVRLGIATEEQAATGLAEAARIGMDLDEEFEDVEELTFLVGDCGLGFQTPEKVTADLDEGYEELLRDAAACSGGSVVVDRVALVRDEDGTEYLHFRRNGRPIWYHTGHLSDTTRYLDWHVAFEALSDLVPGNGDPRRFHQLDEDSYDAWWLLLTPEQAEGLEEFGLPMPVDLGYEIHDPAGGTAPESPAWYREDDRLNSGEDSRRGLDAWLAPMDRALDGWRTACLPGDFPFDHSMDSLAVLERLVLDRYEGPAALEAAEADGFLEGAVRYVGETAVRHLPCRWRFRHAEDGFSLFAGVPTIRTNTPNGFSDEFAPDRLLRSLLADRTPGALLARLEELGSAVDHYRRMVRTLDRTIAEREVR